MSWFDTSNFTSLAKTALSQAQKSIDKVLDIEQDGEGDGTSSVAVKGSKSREKLQKDSLPSPIKKSTASGNKLPDRVTAAAEKSPTSKVEEDSLWSSFLDEKTSTPKKSRSAGQRTNKLGARRQNSRSEKTKPKDQESVGHAADTGSKTPSTARGRQRSQEIENQGGVTKPNESKSVEELDIAAVPSPKLADKNDFSNDMLDSDKQATSDGRVQGHSVGTDGVSTVYRLESDLDSQAQSRADTAQSLEEEPNSSVPGQSGSDVQCADGSGRKVADPCRDSLGEHVPEDDLGVLRKSQEEPKGITPDSISCPNVIDDWEQLPSNKSDGNNESALKDETVLTEVLFQEVDLIAEEILVTEVEGMNATTDSTAETVPIARDQELQDDEVHSHESEGKGPEPVTMEAESVQDGNGSRVMENASGHSDAEKELTDLRQVLQVRETKLVALSKENIDLQETNSILQNQLAQMEEFHRTDDAELEELRQEFTTRVATTESKFQIAAKERDQLKKTLEEKEKSFNAMCGKYQEEHATLLAEKDEQITQLLEEGEKLSKQQLQSNNIVKKLRSKEKESDALIKKQSKKLEELEVEVSQLREVVQMKLDSEKTQEEGILKQNAYVKRQEDLLAKQKSELDDANEKIRSMQTALDNAFKELTELHKQIASEESKAQASVLSTEMTAKEELRIALEKCRREFALEEQAMALQVTDLRTSLSRLEQQSARREDNLRQEISDLQQRLQEAEARNQELTESVTLATRPLLRQIENLQSTYSGQAATLEKVEKNLTDRLNDAQVALAFAQEKERAATEHALELNTRMSTLESQLTTLRQDKSRLEALLEMERSRVDAAEESRTKEIARLGALNAKYKKMVEDANVEKTLLEQQLAAEKGKLETERVRMQAILEEKGKLLMRQASLSDVPPSPPAQGRKTSQIENADAATLKTHVRQSSSGGSNSSVVDSMSRVVMGGSTALVERLQAQVKQKDGEIELLQDDVAAFEKSRDAVTQELSSVTLKLEGLERDKVELGELQVHHQELQQRYNAVLQMYGEKEEEAEELKMDLQDVKSMYKAQIEELLRNSAW